MTLSDVIREVQEEIAAAGTHVNEADAKAAFITPILAELGWRGLSKVRFEYPLAQGQMRLDYALLGTNGKPLALIEAKAPREDLNPHVAQVLNYAFHEGVDICVLTTGARWWLYLPREKGSPAERRFAEIDLRSDDAAEVTESFESCLQYEALTSGAAERRAKEMLDAQQVEQRMLSEIPRAWRRLLAGPNEMLVELVQEEVQDTLGARPTHGQVMSFLATVVTPPANGSADVANTGTQQLARPTPTLRTREDVRVSARPKAKRVNVVALMMWGQRHPVANQRQAFTLAVDLIYQRHQHDFGKVVDAVTGFRFGSPDGLLQPYRIAGSDYYADTNLSFANKQKRLEQLLSAFGYNPSDFEFVTQ